MITYTEKTIQSDDVKIFKQIQQKLAKIDTFPLGAELTCHMLARAIGEVFNLNVVSGYWRPGYEHSWIVTNNRNIIDVYPWGAVGGPILLAQGVTWGSEFYYEADNLFGDISSEEFIESVEIIKEYLH